MRLTSLKYKLRVALCILCVGLCSIGIYAQETQTDIDFLKEFQQGLEKGPIGEAIKVMKDSVGINVYPAFHIADDSALWPYVLELYFDVRAKRKEPYLLVTLVLEPSTGKWTDFSKYSIQVTLTQGQQKAIPQTVLLAAEKHLNEILSDITNLKDYFTQIRDYIAETIQKLRFAMMDKYWEGRQLPLVSFYPGNNQQFGFDSPIQESIIGKYKNFYRYDSITRVPWKALSTTTPDKVNAYIQLRDTAFTKSHVRFINRNSETVFPVQTAGDTLVFQLTGLSNENEDQLTAEYFDTDPLGKERKASLGQVNTIAYENESNTVHIVPVGNAQYPGTKADLERYLNKVYKQAVVQWTVIFDAPIKVKDWDMDGNDTLNIETSMFSRYSDEEQAFVDVLEKQTNYDPKAAYLFVVDMANNMNARGYMPLSAQYGFIFTKVNQSVHDEVYHNTVAHEAGHGVYKLQHPWDIYGTPKYQTDNLMDYQFGATLWKPQWDWIHDPGVRLYMFQKADEGASVIINNIEKLKGWEYQDEAYVFLSPSGIPLILPKRIKSIQFSTGDKVTSKDGLDIIPFGTIISFNLDGKVYKGMWDAAIKTFAWYEYKAEKTTDNTTVNISDDKSQRDIYNTDSEFKTANFINEISSVIVGSPTITDGSIQYNVFQIPNTNYTLSSLKQNKFSVIGKFAPFNLIVEKFKGDLEVRTIAAPPSFSTNNNVTNFIAYYINLNQGLKVPPFYDLYLYTHATLLDHYNLLGKCFASGLPGEFLKNLEAYKYTVKEFDPGTESYYNQTYTVPIKNDYEVDADFKVQVNINAFTHIMDQWSKVDLNCYETMNLLVEKYKNISIPTEITKDNIKKILSLFEAYDETGTDNYDCLFSEFSSDKKIKLLKLILESDYDDTGNDLEKVTNKIFKTLKESEINIVIADIKANPKLLFNAYKKLDNIMNGSYITEFMYQLLKDWQISNLNAVLPGELTNLKLEELAKELTDSKNYTKNENEFAKVIAHNKIILLEDEKILTGNISDLNLEVAWPSIKDGISISQRKEYINTYGETLIKILAPSTYTFGRINNWFSDPIKELKNLNPLAPVVVFISEFQKRELGLRIDPGLYAVPAIFVLWIRDAQKEEIQAFYLRIVLDGVAIALAPLTGGGSAGLITLEIAIPTADIILSAIDKQTNVEDATWKEVYSFWETASNTYYMAFAGIGMIKSIPSVVKGGKTIIRLIANPNAAKEFINVKVWGKLTKFEINKFADEVIKFGDKVIESYGKAWTVYGTRLRDMGLGIKLNFNLHVANALYNIEGIVNGQNYLLGVGENATDLFKFSINNDIRSLSKIRMLKNIENVDEIKYIGILDNVSYTDDGKTFSKLYVVEDAKAPYTYFCLSEDDILKGKIGKTNISGIRAEANILESLEKTIGSKLTGKALEAYNELIKTEIIVIAESGVIKFVDNAGNSVGELKGEKFRPRKFLSGGEVIGEPVDNLQLVKSGSTYGYRIADPTVKVHGIDYNYFINSCDFSNDLNLAEESFYLYREKNWAELENLFKKNKLNLDKQGIPWPPANGGYEIQEIGLMADMNYDRYQEVVNLSKIKDGVPEFYGTYTSPINGEPFGYEARALKGKREKYDLYYEIKIKHDIPEYIAKGEQAKVIPWHGYKGEGLQTKFVFKEGFDMKYLIDNDYIDILIKESPSGKVKILPNNKIEYSYGN